MRNEKFLKAMEQIETILDEFVDNHSNEVRWIEDKHISANENTECEEKLLIVDGFTRYIGNERYLINFMKTNFPKKKLCNYRFYIDFKEEQGSIEVKATDKKITISREGIFKKGINNKPCSGEEITEYLQDKIPYFDKMINLKSKLDRDHYGNFVNTIRILTDNQSFFDAIDIYDDKLLNSFVELSENTETAYFSMVLDEIQDYLVSRVGRDVCNVLLGNIEDKHQFIMEFVLSGLLPNYCYDNFDNNFYKYCGK